MDMYMAVAHRGWKNLSNWKRNPYFRAVNWEPHFIVTEARPLHVTLWLFPLDSTSMLQMKPLSSGHLQSTVEADPVAGGRAAVVAAAVPPWFCCEFGQRTVPLAEQVAPPVFVFIGKLFTPLTPLHLTLSVTSVKVLLQL